MTMTWANRASTLLLALSMAAAGSAAANAERWPGSTASIGGAIAARIIAVKCSGPLTPVEIGELDTYIDERQTAFMSESKANQRMGETVFPILARDYDRTYANPEACDAAARDMAKDMLQRVRSAEADLKKRAEVK